MRGLSGGERKRLAIGAELISAPSVMFLDEPTTGLDAFMSAQVVGALRALADCGHTVVVTIHQPRSSVFAAFDDLLLVSEGRVVYHGPAADVLAHFAALGHACPEHYNPAGESEGGGGVGGGGGGSGERGEGDEAVWQGRGRERHSPPSTNQPPHPLLSHPIHSTTTPPPLHHPNHLNHQTSSPTSSPSTTRRPRPRRRRARASRCAAAAHRRTVSRAPHCRHCRLSAFASNPLVFITSPVQSPPPTHTQLQALVAAWDARTAGAGSGGRAAHMPRTASGVGAVVPAPSAPRGSWFK